MDQEDTRKTRVLVTGGYGFIGGHLVDALVAGGYEVAVLDALVQQVHPENKPPAYAHPTDRVPFFEGYVQDVIGKALSEFRPHAVVHLAALVGVGQAEREIAEYVDSNVFGTSVLLEAILRHNDQIVVFADPSGEEPGHVHSEGIGRMVVASSMSAYGEGLWSCATHGSIRTERRPEDLAFGRWEPRCPYDGCEGAVSPIPIAEWSSLRPAGIYAATKRDQEEYTLLVAKSTGLSAAACRFFNVIGERQALTNPYTGVAAIFAARCLAGVAPRVYEDGEQLRDFIHVSDVVSALIALIGPPWLPQAQRLWAQPTYQGSFNVCTGAGSSVGAVAELACAVLAPQLQPEITGEYRVGDIRACYGDPSKLIEATGWEPKVSAEEALTTLFEGLKGSEAPAPVGELDRAHEELIARGLLVAPLSEALAAESEQIKREPTRWG